MRNIKIVYRYDGSMFYGSQRQPNKRTVQGEIEKVLKIVLKESVDLISSGRTDRGVHALYQVSNFITMSTIPIDKLKYVISKLIPMDIEIIDVVEVELEFNSRFDAKERTYLYKMSWQKNPFKARYVTLVKDKMELSILETIFKKFQGTHNFNNFRLSDCGSKNPIRTINYIKVFEDNGEINVEINANSFLKSQIRIIIGTVLDIYFNKKNIELIDEMLKNPNKKFIKKVADPNGLYLKDIIY